MRKLIALAKANWTSVLPIGVFLIVMAIAYSGLKTPFSDTDISQEKPFADYVGREYRVRSEVSAYAWNDFPDKSKILTISLQPTPLYKSRFVSYIKPIPKGQMIRILSAWKQFTLEGFHRHYLVSVSGLDLPSEVPIRMDVSSGGCPDPNIYEPVN